MEQRDKEKVETFLKSYDKLDEYLRHNVTQAREPFYARLEAFARKHSGLQWHMAKLKDYADLRNIIIHYHDSRGGTIAVPTDAALQEFERSVDAILSPPRLIPQFQKAHIRSFLPNEPLVAALRHMQEHDYSQVVVREDFSFSLLTVEGITRWLEEQEKEEIIIVGDARIADAQKHEQLGDAPIMKRNQTVYEAMEIFRNSIEQKKPRIYALLITEHGNATERLLGIVTPWDLLSYANS